MESTKSSFKLNMLNKLSFFLSGDLFILAFTAITYGLSFIKRGDISISIVMLIIALIFFTQKDLKSIFTPFMLMYFGMPFLMDGIFDINVVFILSIIILITSVIYYVLKNKPKLNFTKNLAILIPYACAYPLGGWFAPNNLLDGNFYLLSVGLAILLYVAFLLFALLAGNCNLTDKEYIFKVIFASGVLISMQIFTRAIFTHDFLDVVSKDSFMLNWGIYNGIITAMLFAVPSCFYFALKRPHQTVFFIVIAFIEVIATFLTGSRASIVCMPLVLVICFLLTIHFSTGKQRQQITTIFCSVGIILVTALMITLILSPDILEKVFWGFTVSGLQGNGRDKVWFKSLQLFTTNPIFGVGLFHNFGETLGLAGNLWLSHNTAFQALSSLGIVGFIGIWRHTLSKYRSCCKYNALTAFIFIMFLCTEAYGMIDCLMPAPYYVMPLISLLILLDVNPQNHSEKLPVAKMRNL